MRNTDICWTYPGRYDAIMDTRNEKLSDYLAGKKLKILDLGCSVGIEVSRLASENPQHNFIGLDIDARVIDIARTGMWSIPNDLIGYLEHWNEDSIKNSFEFLNHGQGPAGFKTKNWDNYPYLKLTKHPLPNLTYFVGDYESISFGNEQFDIILAFVCGLLPTNEKANYNLLNLLKPKGHLITEISTIQNH